ncbi:hypothetical protein [Bacillus albus]
MTGDSSRWSWISLKAEAARLEQELIYQTKSLLLHRNRDFYL